MSVDMWNCHSWPLNSEEVTLLSVRCHQGGPSAFGYHEQHWTVKRSLCCLSDVTGGYIISFTQVKLTFPDIFLLVDFSLYLPISWLFRMGSHWSHWTAKSSLCPLAVSNGGRGIFPYIFLLVDCFKWALIGHIEKCRVPSVLWQFQMGGGGYFLPYIFLLVDHFEWALICDIGQWRVDSALWQFQMGGGGIFPSLYILISWPFRMGSHWWQWTAKSWLSALAVSNGGRGDISFLIYSY